MAKKKAVPGKPAAKKKSRKAATPKASKKGKEPQVAEEVLAPPEAPTEEPAEEEKKAPVRKTLASIAKDGLASIPSCGQGPQDYRPTKTVKFGTLEMYHHKGMVVIIDNGVRAENTGGHMKTVRHTDILKIVSSHLMALNRVPLWGDEDRALRKWCEEAYRVALAAKAFGDPCDVSVQKHFAKHKKRSSGLVDHTGRPLRSTNPSNN